MKAVSVAFCLSSLLSLSLVVLLLCTGVAHGGNTVSHIDTTPSPSSLRIHLPLKLQKHSSFFQYRPTTASRRSLQQALDTSEVTELYGDAGSHFSYYFVEVEIGTPSKNFSVIVDTGSGKLIVPASDCVGGCGTDHEHRYGYNYGESSTGNKITCSSTCSDYCQGNECRFAISFLEGSSLSGYETSDQITLASSHHHNTDTSQVSNLFRVNMRFGAATTMTNLFLSQFADGIMGLERIPNWKTIIDQMYFYKKITKNVFSICAGPTGGALVLGASITYEKHMRGDADTPKIIWANMSLNDRIKYRVFITKWVISGRELPSNILNVANGGAGALVDSGNTALGMPYLIYEEVMASIRNIASKNSIQTANMYGLTCFGNMDRDIIPTWSITFEGSTEPLEVSLDHYILRFKRTGDTTTWSCPNIDQSGNSVTLGAVFIRGFETIFDREHSRIGFTSRSMCTSNHVEPSSPPTPSSTPSQLPPTPSPYELSTSPPTILPVTPTPPRPLIPSITPTAEGPSPSIAPTTTPSPSLLLPTMAISPSIYPSSFPTDTSIPSLSPLPSSIPTMFTIPTSIVTPPTILSIGSPKFVSHGLGFSSDIIAIIEWTVHIKLGSNKFEPNFDIISNIGKLNSNSKSLTTTVLKSSIALTSQFTTNVGEMSYTYEATIHKGLVPATYQSFRIYAWIPASSSSTKSTIIKHFSDWSIASLINDPATLSLIHPVSLSSVTTTFALNLESSLIFPSPQMLQSTKQQIQDLLALTFSIQTSQIDIVSLQPGSVIVTAVIHSSSENTIDARAYIWSLRNQYNDTTSQLYLILGSLLAQSPKEAFQMIAYTITPQSIAADGDYSGTIILIIALVVAFVVIGGVIGTVYYMMTRYKRHVEVGWCIKYIAPCWCFKCCHTSLGTFQQLSTTSDISMSHDSSRGDDGIDSGIELDPIGAHGMVPVTRVTSLDVEEI